MAITGCLKISCFFALQGSFMKIFFSSYSPFVRKCLVVAHELGLSDRIQLLSSNVNPVKRDQSVIAKNPLGKVPTFITDDEQVIYDSRVICEYLNELVHGHIFPIQGVARWNALTLQALGDGILDAAILIRYEEALRPVDLQWNDWRIGQFDKVETSFAYLNAHPQSLTSDTADIGNLTIACALWYLDLRFDEWNWREKYPEIEYWYRHFSKRESLQMTWSL